ncbi:sugar ABC transporter permease [Agromyces sp. NPDC058110]|uniref:sugar ABC transporter permease n=1 Tax=Agromyces sp. NPDC058110 TaxID=3346345 RepID=UPI0036DCCA7F
MSGEQGTTTPTSTPPTDSTTALSALSTEQLIGSGQEGGLMDQVRAYFQRVRSGEMGALPAVGGFVVLSILFTVLSPYFFTERNFANLLTQAATLVMLGMALVFVLLLGEIDLSAGVTAGLTMVIFVVLVQVVNLNWVLALAIAFLTGVAIGTFIGFFVAKVGIPSFVVTLGLFLGFQGLELIIIGAGGLYRVETPEILAIQNGTLPPWGGWVMLAVMLAISAGTSFLDRSRRTRAGVPNRTIALVWAKLLTILVLGGIVVAILNQNRGTGFKAIEGVPIVVPITLAILWLGTFVLDRTKFGRYIYAVGGNAEAARRSGVKVAMIRWCAFIVCSSLAVVAGLFSISKVGSVDAAAGREIVLSGVAAAVVGGVSLFGGRGRLIHAAIGALVIAVITNGLGLLNLPAGVNYAVTGGVLILAATVDAISRKRAGGSILRT